MGAWLRPEYRLDDRDEGSLLMATCDVCHQPTARIVAKLFFTPKPSESTKAKSNDYSLHASVGECCEKRVTDGTVPINWHARSRRNGDG